MANNYLLSSTLYPVKAEDREKAEKIIQEAIERIGLSEMGIEPEKASDADCEEARDYVTGLIDFEDDGFWFRHDESANADAFAEIISELQVALKTDKPFIFSYCYECSKPRLDEFGGGAYAIMPDGEILHIDAVSEVQCKAEAKMKEKK